MRPNLLKQKIAAGTQVINAWCSIPCAYTAEGLGTLGFDAITIDLQHGPIDDAHQFAMLQALAHSPSTPLVRVPWNDPAALMRALDAGAYGVICPMINSAAEAEAFVSACRYPPRGRRSFGPNRAIMHAEVASAGGYLAGADREILLFAMIETREALAALEEILSIDGLDGVYVGPGDLSLALGERPTMTPEAPQVVAAIGGIARAARARGRIAAIHTDGPETARLRFSQGYQLCTLQSDFRFMMAGAATALKSARAGD